MDKTYKKTELFEGAPFPFYMSHQKGRHTLVFSHWHEHPEFIKVLRGRVEIKADNMQYIAGANDIIFINSSQLHSVDSLYGRESELIGMVFDKFFLTNITEGFEPRYFYELFIRAPYFDGFFDKSHPLYDEINHCITASYNEYKSKKMLFDVSIKSNLYKLMTCLIRNYYDRPSIKESYQKNINDLIGLRPVFEHIDSNYMDKIYLKTLSDLFNLSISPFSRYFKRTTGYTVTEYILSVRLNDAKNCFLIRPCLFQIYLKCQVLGASTILISFLKESWDLVPASIRKG